MAESLTVKDISDKLEEEKGKPKSLSKLVEGCITRIEKLEQDNTKLSGDLKSVQNEKDGLEAFLKDYKENLTSAQQGLREVLTLQSNLQTMCENIENAHTQVLKAPDDDSKSKLDEIKTAWDEITAARGEIIGGEESSHNGLKGQIKEHKKDFERLTKQIEALLPRGAAAGLAHAFYDAKRDYRFSWQLPNPEIEKKWWHTGSRWLMNALNWLKNTMLSGFYYALFLVPLALAVALISVPFIEFEIIPYILSLLTSQTTNIHDFEFNNATKGSTDLLLMILGRGAISTPLFFISLFGYQSIRNRQKLFEEYNHKQRVMQLYDGFKEELEESGVDAELRSGLLSTMLDVIARRPMSKHAPKADKAYVWPQDEKHPEASTRAKDGDDET